MKSNQTESPKYFFNIHHRNIDVLINQDGTFEPATSYTGHLYLTLHADDQVDYFVTPKSKMDRDFKAISKFTNYKLIDDYLDHINKEIN